MMFHVEQNKKNLHCETKDYLVTGEKFKVYLDQNNIIGKTHPVPQKEEMNKYYESADLIIMTAAVSDHRPSISYDRKLHKQEFPEKIELIPNPDILNELGLKKKQNQLLVGFAAETNDILESARKKLHKKNLDWIVVNDVSKSETGFASDKNEVIVLSSDGTEKMLSSDYKSNIAEKLLNIFSSSCLEKAL